MVFETAGWLGMILIVASYLLLSTKKIDDRSFIYHLLNLLGAIGVVINAYASGAWPVVSLNIFWAVIAVYNLVK